MMLVESQPCKSNKKRLAPLYPKHWWTNLAMQVAAMMLKESLSKLMSYLREVQMGMVYGAINLSRRGISTFPVEVLIGMLL